jgi:hypothetical protein
MAVFSGLYHPADMSMLKNMLNQQQQQRQFGQQLQQRESEQKQLQDYRMLQQKMAEEKANRDTDLRQAQIETEQMKQKTQQAKLDRDEKYTKEGTDPVFERQKKLAQFKEDNKFKHEITSSSTFLNKAANSVNRMFDALEKNKSLTSPLYGLPVIGNIAKKTFGSKELGAFAADAANLQTQYANLELSRPGIKTVEFYKQTKPDEGAGEKYNYGMLLANAHKIKDIWENGKSNWERKFPNTKYPIPNPNMNRIINSVNGIENFDSDVPEKVSSKKQYSSEQLDEYYQQAIRAGVDPEKADELLAKLRGNM